MAEEDIKPIVGKLAEETKALEVASVTLLANNPLACNMCGKIFVTRRELLIHQWSHKERQNFYCPNCDKNFNNENQFKRHMHVHTKEGKKFVTCDICKKVFRNNRVLEEHHVQDHTGQKPYRCGTCGIQFSWRENLRKHLHTHIDKPYACTICHESFRDNDTLEVHGKIHKREMKELEKREQERKELEERERRRELHKQMGVFSVGVEAEPKKIEEVDEEEKVFKCGVCNQSFRYAFTLEAHMKGHVEEGVELKKEDEDVATANSPQASPLPTPPPPKITTSNPVFAKPHICSICQQSFRWEFCLDAHLKIHKQGYDAKLEKEKERRAQKKAKVVRKQEAMVKKTGEGSENGQEKQEGTVVIVVEPIPEEEQKEAEAKRQSRRHAQSAKKLKKKKQTRREAMAEQLPYSEPHLEEDDEGLEEDTVNQEITFEFADVVDTDSPSSEVKMAESEEEMPDAKPPKLSLDLPGTNLPLKKEKGRGRAKTRGGARVNHINLHEVVASIGKETRQSIIGRKRVSTRGGRAGTTRGYREDSDEDQEKEIKEEEDDGAFGFDSEIIKDEPLAKDTGLEEDVEIKEEDGLDEDMEIKEEEEDEGEEEESDEGEHEDVSGEEEEENDDEEEESVDGGGSDQEDVGSEPEEDSGAEDQASGDEDQPNSDDEEADEKDISDEEFEEEEKTTSRGKGQTSGENPTPAKRRKKEEASDEDDDEDDDEDFLHDDLDEQELLKLKMKVYSCELCSKAFVQADLLMEHKVNYHQQNGDGVRNIFSKVSKPRSHSKVLPTSSSVSSSKRGSR